MKSRFKSIQKLDRQLDTECRKQTAVIYSAACIALYEQWGWKQKRLNSLFGYIEEGLNECARFMTKKSILEMLEEETGIEMRLEENGRSYHDIDYLNGSLGMYQIEKMSYAQIMAMRLGQIKWTKALIEASLFLALNRRNGFGAERLQRLLNQIFEIETEHNGDQDALVRECEKRTGINVRERIRIIG